MLMHSLCFPSFFPFRETLRIKQKSNPSLVVVGEGTLKELGKGNSSGPSGSWGNPNIKGILQTKERERRILFLLLLLLLLLLPLSFLPLPPPPPPNGPTRPSPSSSTLTCRNSLMAAASSEATTGKRSALASTPSAKA